MCKNIIQIIGQKMLQSRHKLAACQPCLTHNYIFFSFMVFQKYESGVNISNWEISLKIHTRGCPESEVSPDLFGRQHLLPSTAVCVYICI